MISTLEQLYEYHGSSFRNRMIVSSDSPDSRPDFKMGSQKGLIAQLQSALDSNLSTFHVWYMEETEYFVGDQSDKLLTFDIEFIPSGLRKNVEIKSLATTALLAREFLSKVKEDGHSDNT